MPATTVGSTSVRCETSWSGNTLGASQVTAVVERAADYNGGRLYVVALRAHLVDPYFIRLTDPVMEQQHEASYRARAA